MGWHQPLHRTFVAIDIEGFNRPEWQDPVRARLRAELHSTLREAFERAGVAAERYVVSDLGDGMLVLIDPAVSKVTLLDPFLHELEAGLRDYNRGASAQLRLRIVLHAGEILPDSHGWTGAALNHAFRLLGDDQLRAALAATSGQVALIVSEPIYRAVVEHEWRGIQKSEYQRVIVTVKETTAPAWIHAPGWQAPQMAPEADRKAGGGHGAAQQRAGVTNIVHRADNVINGPVEVARDFVINPRPSR
jgi:hypothetical protein